jgi:ankyrin repeat protein
MEFISDATALLLAHNAPVKAKNAQGWNCLMEAVSYGDRQISKQKVIILIQKNLFSYNGATQDEVSSTRKSNHTETTFITNVV